MSSSQNQSTLDTGDGQGYPEAERGRRQRHEDDGGEGGGAKGDEGGPPERGGSASTKPVPSLVVSSVEPNGTRPAQVDEYNSPLPSPTEDFSFRVSAVWVPPPGGAAEGLQAGGLLARRGGFSGQGDNTGQSTERDEIQTPPKFNIG
ncbi:hypothetical protein BaRGS_00026246, partial [Batillaria attramentaria]